MAGSGLQLMCGTFAEAPTLWRTAAEPVEMSTLDAVPRSMQKLEYFVRNIIMVCAVHEGCRGR